MPPVATATSLQAHCTGAAHGWGWMNPLITRSDTGLRSVSEQYASIGKHTLLREEKRSLGIYLYNRTLTLQHFKEAVSSSIQHYV